MNSEHVTAIIGSSGSFPNNDRLPVIIYYNVAGPTGTIAPEFFEKLFRSNGWTGSWRNGVYPFHHYHSTAHEVLGVYGGSVRIILGGNEGKEFELTAGDVVIIPAGVSHKRISSTRDFAVLGAYPEGTAPDMCYGKEGELAGAQKRIASLPLPGLDPVLGQNGMAVTEWKES